MRTDKPGIANATAEPEPEEIEVTAEMIAAGRSELLGYEHDYESAESAVGRIYCAMALTALASSVKAPNRCRGKRR